MVGMSKNRKALYVFLFTFATVLGLLIFNIYPTILNTYTSITNRNKFRPYPDCEVTLNNILVPFCWPGFEIPRGTGGKFVIIEPLIDNYSKILGDVFTVDGLVNFGLVLLCFVPMVVAWRLDRRYNQQLERRFSSGIVWLVGGSIAILCFLVFGFSAWRFLLNSGDFMAVLLRTILFVILRVPLTFVLGLLMALIVTSPGLPMRNFWRLVLFVPWAASSVAILTSLIWQFFFREQGTINQILDLLFGIQGPVWLNNPLTAFGIILLVDIWYSYPFFMIAILGAMAAISDDAYEAAEIDGATYWDQLKSITLPLIRPAILPAIVLTSITAFQMFGTVWAITQGGPTAGAGKPGATELVLVYGYKQIFQLQNYGTATAFATIIFIMLFIVTIWSLRVSRLTRGVNE
jgi:arabinogalactan oligomer/maltooligosaccharide transport system permease protein